MNLFDLSNKVAMVTGASRGLGRAMSIGLAGAGAHIAAIGRNKNSLNETADEINKIGGACTVFQTDLCDDAAVRETVRDAVDRLGKLDILVNNAGISSMTKAMDISKMEWNHVMDTNMNSVFVLSKEVGRDMIERKEGNIINIASIYGKMASNQSLHYCASKAAVIHMTRGLALEWAPFNIRVNCIAPGFFQTEMTVKQQENKKHHDFLIRKIPLKRFGKPEEIIGSVLYLASNASQYVTGATLFIDGGYSLW